MLSSEAAGLVIQGAKGLIKLTRRVDLILVAGSNVYPAEIEELLVTHPDIAQAQVFGLPDARPVERHLIDGYLFRIVNERFCNVSDQIFHSSISFVGG